MSIPSTPRELLAEVLKLGCVSIGEILIGGNLTLRHATDESVSDEDDLEIFEGHQAPYAARAIARYDEQGNYRPLKTAPNLKRGWLIKAGTLEGVELAVDFFYPAALGLWLSWLRGTLTPTPFRETLGRQTGMYRVTQLISREQAADLIARRCTSHGGCLRTILWEMVPGEAISSLPASKLRVEGGVSGRIPLICREVCNLVVAAARPIAKENLAKENLAKESLAKRNLPKTE
jgi:sirohydrochlorin cobaltochelatase